MSQNTSSAVMQQRREPSDSFDYFPTPPWATRALCDWLVDEDFLCPTNLVREPACGQGHMARVLSEYCETVIASDIQDMGYGEQGDYLFLPQDQTDWTITNPPFRLAQEFIDKACRHSRYGVAMLTRISFLEGIQRHKELFLENPPSYILQFVERVPMVKGRVDPKISSATSYCWIVWIDGEGHFNKDGTTSPIFGWLPPCRKRLEREGDYDAPLLAGCA